ncbi:MAG TPA: hypothetical protein VF088_05135, partial [Pyrinomonadaceae bacterium]
MRMIMQLEEHHSGTAKAILLALFLLLPKTAVLAQVSDWAQWGGPHRNFTSEARGLAATWPA